MSEQEQSDHDVLLEVKSDVKWLKEGFNNHLKHHFRYNIMAWSAAISAIIALILLLCK